MTNKTITADEITTDTKISINYVSRDDVSSVNIVETVDGNAKTTQYKKDLTQTYIALELQKFYENVLHREYVIKIQDYDYRYISAEKRHEVETSLGITEDDIHKILIEKERLTKNFHESLAKVFAQGVKLDAKTMLRTQDLIAELNKLEKLGKK